MIALLRGTVAEKSTSRVVVDVHGIGYDVLVPLSTFFVVGEPGAEVSLRVHTHVREDTLALYGFATALEQELFERLISISGIGPKLALAVLSGIEPPELIKAIRLQNVARLMSIPGVGRRTAERISLELKDRLPQAVTEGAQAQLETGGDDQMRTDLLSALMNLGYQRPAAEKAIDGTLRTSPDVPFETALRQVLRSLMRS